MYMDGMGSNGKDFFYDYGLYYTYLFYTIFEWSYCGQKKSRKIYSVSPSN